MPVFSKIFDEVLDNALLVFRYAASERASTWQRLQALANELVAQLAQEEVTSKDSRRVEAFIAETGTIIQQRFEQLQLEFAYDELAMTVANDIRYGIAVAYGIDALYLPPDHYFQSLQSDVMILGAPSSDWWRGQSQDLQFKFAQQVRIGLGNAETNQQIISRIVGKNGQPGIMETARRNAAALVQTSVQAVANDARRNTFKANPDVVTGIQQVSTLDSHTSTICIAYSGAKWDLDDKPIAPNKLKYNGGVPRHFNCRSVEVPITKTFKELGLNIAEAPVGMRTSDEGLIAEDTSFDSFLKRKSSTYQNNMLGKGRADLWRNGKITLKDLVDGKGRPLTLAELQAAIDAKRR